MFMIGSRRGVINDPCFTLQYLYHAVGSHATYEAWQHTFWHYHRVTELEKVNCKVVVPACGGAMIASTANVEAGTELLRIYGWL
jgi:hypothetical protein